MKNQGLLLTAGLFWQNFSMTGWRYIQVVRTDEAEECTVTVSNAELAGKDSEHKVKLSSLMISTKGEVVEGEEALSMVDLAMQNLGSAQILEDDATDEGERRVPLPDLHCCHCISLQLRRTREVCVCSRVA